jgi:hypothetical protein
MPLWVILLVQGLHIGAGITWVGTVVGLDLLVWPALLRMPAADGRALYGRVVQAIGPVSGVAGGLTILLGIVRGTVLGPITSFGFLFGQPYGITWLVAIALTIVVLAEGGVWQSRVNDLVWAGDGVRPGAARLVYAQSAIELGLFAAIIACMVLMAFGL